MAGAAAVVAAGAAAGLAEAAAGFLGAGFFGAGLRAGGGGAAAARSTESGLGCKRLVPSPIDTSSSCSVSGLWPARLNVMLTGPVFASASVHGVIQVSPLEARACAPGGLDSSVTVFLIGAGFKASKLSQSGVEEHAARVAALAIIVITRYMIVPTHGSVLPYVQFTLELQQSSCNGTPPVNLTALTICRRLSAVYDARNSIFQVIKVADDVVGLKIANRPLGIAEIDADDGYVSRARGQHIRR